MTEKLQTTSLVEVYEQRMRVSQSKHWGENGPSTLVRHSLYSESCYFFFFTVSLLRVLGLPWWLSGKESACQCRRCVLNSWVGKIPQRRKWQATPVFLPGKFHGQRGVLRLWPMGHKRVWHDLATKKQQKIKSTIKKASQDIVPTSI